MAFLMSSYPAKLMAPSGATQKNRGTAPRKNPRGPSWRKMESATTDIVAGCPWRAIIILVLITSNGVVETAVSPPDIAPTAMVSQVSSSRPRNF